MGRARFWTAFLPSLVLGLAGCDGGGGQPDAGDGGPDGGDGGDGGVERPPERCLEPTGLGSGPYFTEVTEELGLSPAGLDVQGTGVVSADLDGDRWPDLVVLRRVNGSARDDPAAPRWDARVLRNDRGRGFEDVTMESGLLATRDGGWGRPVTILVFADVDDDGDTDAFAGVQIDADSGTTGDVSEVMLNQGDGTFVFGPEGDFCEDRSFAPIYSATFVDHDLDGRIDLFLGYQYGRYGYVSSAMQDELHAGLGDGSFASVTDEAGLRTGLPIDRQALEAGSAHKPTWGTTACDVNGDGWPELMAASYGLQYNPFHLGLGDGAYEEIGQAVGFWSDGLTDYSDNLKYQCHCHVFDGACDPMPPRPRYGCWDQDLWGSDDAEPYRLGGNTSGQLCGDLDGDGDMDVVNVELDHDWAGESTDRTELLVNEGVGSGGTFVRPGREATGLVRDHVLGWNEGDLGGALVDFDNDGRLDIWILSSAYPGTASLLYWQLGDGTFEDVAELAGVRVPHGLGGALVDYDRDGDHDLVVGLSRNSWEEALDGPRPEADHVRVFRNDVGHTRNRLMLHLEGAGAPGANRSAIGARVEVRASGRLLVREVMAGEGHDSYQHDPLLVVGLDSACRADEVTIRWPNAGHTTTTIRDVPANYVLVVHETEGYEFQTLEEHAAR